MEGAAFRSLGLIAFLRQAHHQIARTLIQQPDHAAYLIVSDVFRAIFSTGKSVAKRLFFCTWRAPTPLFRNRLLIGRFRDDALQLLDMDAQWLSFQAEFSFPPICSDCEL